MSAVYLDTSAIIRYLTREPGHELFTTLWNKSDAVITSVMTDIEVRAVLHAGQRANLMTAREVSTALGEWESMMPACYSVQLSERVQSEAGKLTAQHRLRAADAVHLASALRFHHSAGAIIMAAWDESLRNAASVEGMSLAPSNVGSQP